MRIVRHVERDLDDLVRRGFTGVLHTFSENDLAYYRDTMKRIVDASHARGLEVQMNPWGLGRTFGGEAESRFVTMNPDACQVLDDGRRVAAACLNNPRYRAFCAEWADAALDAGADLVFWDEPHWVVPEHVGVDDATRWSCRCDVCRERFGRDFPADLDDEVLAFREASLVDFLGELTAHVRSRGGRNTICLLPAVEGAHGVQRLGRRRVAARRRRLRDRSLLEELRRGGRPVRSHASRSSSSRRRPATASPPSSGSPRFASRRPTSPTSRTR